jgi:tetratricopeptide (TPR) repeat protein
MGLALVAAIILAYQPAWNAGFIWDDDAYVTRNPLLTAPDGLQRIWFSLDSPSQYFPLTYTTFRWERAWWGLNPAGYHWVNILLHSVGALLLWRLLRLLTLPGAWLAAALWALHPVQVESVAWVTERKNVLMLLFFLLTLRCWIQFVRPQPKPPWIQYGLALIFYALALFSKTTACTLPAALLLVLWLKRWPISWTRVVQVIPFLVLSLGMGLVSMWWERFHQGTQGNLFSMGLAGRLLVASHAIWFYAGKLFWPVNLSFIYPRWAIEPGNPLAYGWLVLSIGAGSGIYYCRRFVGRSVETGTLFYVATLSPLLGFIMLYTFLYTFVADHYQYVASIGLITLVAAGITVVFKNWARFRLLVSTVLLLTLGALTWRQARIYQTPESLWRDTLTKNPDGWLPNSSLGGVLIDEGRLNEAMKYCVKAVRLNPDFADSLNNLGVVLADKGEFDEAIVYYNRAIQINPDFAEALNNLGVALAAKGATEEAVQNYRKAIQLNPNYGGALVNLGIALAAQGQFPKAVECYQRAIQLNPKHSETYSQLGLALYQMGRHREAVAAYEQALRLNTNLPGTLNNLAWVRATSPDDAVRDGNEAVRLAEHACKLTHYEEPLFIGTLAAAYAEAGRYTDATGASRKACDLARSRGQDGLALREEKMMQLFEGDRPYREQAIPGK